MGAGGELTALPGSQLTCLWALPGHGISHAVGWDSQDLPRELKPDQDLAPGMECHSLCEVNLQFFV